MTPKDTMRRDLAAYLLENDRMVVEPTADLRRLFLGLRLPKAGGDVC